MIRSELTSEQVYLLETKEDYFTRNVLFIFKSSVICHLTVKL